MLSTASFQDYLFSACAYTQGASVLAGVSGGVDSVVLCHLLKQNGIPFGIAHVNYGLRGNESEEDEKFVSELARKLDVPFYLKKCSSDDFEKTGENSIQFAARKIRYSFFEFISMTNGFSNIATAHHLDDSIETALLNFARGTGVAGLRAMQPRKEKIIRPLLFTTRLEILDYANSNGVVWREDSSNESDKYSRNRFRHHLLPWLMSEIPQGYAGFESSFSKLSETEKFIHASLSFWKNKCCEVSSTETRISLDNLNQFPDPELFLKFFLLEQDFSEVKLTALSDLINGESGTQLVSHSSRLIRDRNHLFLIHENKNRSGDFIFTEEPFTGQIPTGKFSAIVDAKSVRLPFQIRSWKSGDRMIPFGMTGHRNVSDILNDMKIPLHKKEAVRVILSGEEIVWIPGYRIADKFKVNPTTSTVIKLSYEE